MGKVTLKQVRLSTYGAVTVGNAIFTQPTKDTADLEHALEIARQLRQNGLERAKKAWDATVKAWPADKAFEEKFEEELAVLDDAHPVEIQISGAALDWLRTRVDNTPPDFGVVAGLRLNLKKTLTLAPNIELNT